MSFYLHLSFICCQPFFMYQFIHQSVWTSNPCINSSINQFGHPIHVSIHPSISSDIQSMYQFIHQPVRTSNPCLNSSINQFKHPIHVSIVHLLDYHHRSIHLSTHQLIITSIPQFVYHSSMIHPTHLLTSIRNRSWCGSYI